MQSRLSVMLLGIVIVSTSAGCSQTKAQESEKEDEAARQDLGAVTVKLPAGWKSVKPSSEFRKAQYVLPKVAGDAEDAELVVFYFGKGQGGSVEDNLKRWEGQFIADEKAKVTRKKVAGLPVTVMDISGTYKESVGGMFSGETKDKPNFRMFATIVETPEGSYFFKLTGPAQTIARWEKSFDAFLNSVRKK